PLLLRHSRLVLTAVLLLTGARGFAAEIGADIRQAIAGSGEARVVVSLLPVAEPKTPAAARQPVLAALDALPRHDFRQRIAFRASAAFAATVSARALVILDAHPGVDRVDLDVGGTGGLDETVPLISADVLHGQGVTGAGVVVAVLD